MQQLNSNRIAPGLHDLCIKRIGEENRESRRRPELHLRDIYSRANVNSARNIRNVKKNQKKEKKKKKLSEIKRQKRALNQENCRRLPRVRSDPLYCGIRDRERGVRVQQHKRRAAACIARYKNQIKLFASPRMDQSGISKRVELDKRNSVIRMKETRPQKCPRNRSHAPNHWSSASRPRRVIVLHVIARIYATTARGTHTLVLVNFCRPCRVSAPIRRCIRALRPWRGRCQVYPWRRLSTRSERDKHC
ncbi:hypothetical protein PUN28_004141 [Cardiocondyla obscurior]|uniref:Uncharacterized protein n=1 Tax=Cardiocondyla obscurior TaxID=286306 RepID=A0AAW2GPR4_9HYME